MNLSLLWRHTSLLVVFTICLLLPFVLMINLGIAKGVEEYKWTDIVGEGSVALLTILWVISALASRPPGLVTRMLVLGLSCFMFSSLLDVIDEFLRYDSKHIWMSMVESIPAAIGMIIMSVGLYLWHLEQLALNRQLQGRELEHRSFEKIDVITQLYRVDYWRERAEEIQQRNISAAIVVLDINNFSNFNLKFGDTEGDRFLREVAHLILMNLRPTDLVSRYAGDRFVILLPESTLATAVDMAEQVENSVKNVAFKANEQTTATFQSVRTAVRVLMPNTSLQQCLTELNIELDNKSQLVNSPQNNQHKVA